MKGTILIVDDNHKNLELISQSFQGTGYQIALADSGSSAIECAKAERFDLFILDVMMPGMNGFELSDILRKDLKLKAPVIFLTARADKEDVLQGFERGGQDYLTKPFDKRELLARVDTQIELFRTKSALEQMNLLLEAKVDERTRELSEANRDLNRANEKLMSLDKAKMDFLGIISHELRTPLNGIKGFASLLKQTNQSKMLDNLINMLIVSVDTLEEFSSLALDITSLRLNKHKLKVTFFPLMPCLIRAVESCRIQAEERDVTVAWDIPQSGLDASGEEAMIQRAVAIVVDNAVKHTARGSRVRIAVRGDEAGLGISIADEGRGFHPSLLEGGMGLFQTGTKHINKNMGLDLPLVRLIVLAHNGTLELANRPEGGAEGIQLPPSRWFSPIRSPGSDL
ncbi:MAG: hybrid sensor histidine kinase/response regulator [Bacteroidales bacterium]